MAQEDNVIVKNNNYQEDDIIETCCVKDNNCNYKENCNANEGCSGISVSVCDINLAECVPILAERIYDCILQSSEQFMAGDEIDFVIDCWNENNYGEDQPICINKIAVNYDFIGARLSDLDGDGVEDGISVKIGSANNKTSFMPTSAACYRTGGDNPINLYSKFVTVVPGKRFISDQGATKVKVLTDGIELYAANLRISVIGKIGCRRFSATSVLRDKDEDGNDLGYNALNLNRLTGSNPSVYGRVCIPNNSESKSLYLEFNHHISVDCVTANSVYTDLGIDGEGNEVAPGHFRASIEGSLLLKNILTPTTTEKLVVFTIPDEIDCD